MKTLLAIVAAPIIAPVAAIFVLIDYVRKFNKLKGKEWCDYKFEVKMFLLEVFGVFVASIGLWFVFSGVVWFVWQLIVRF